MFHSPEMGRWSTMVLTSAPPSIVIGTAEKRQLITNRSLPPRPLIFTPDVVRGLTTATDTLFRKISIFVLSIRLLLIATTSAACVPLTVTTVAGVNVRDGSDAIDEMDISCRSSRVSRLGRKPR